MDSQAAPGPRAGLGAHEVRAKHKEFLFPAVTNYYQEPLVLVEGKGMRLKDAEGRSYLDFFGGILTISVGHANEHVNAAVKAQLDRLGHVSTVYPTAPLVQLAEKLASITPGALRKCYITSSGTEADETGVMMAQVYTGRLEVIALRHGYSGRSMLAQSLTGHAGWRATPTQVAAIKHAAAPYCYRCPFGLAYPSCGVKCAKDVEELIRTTTTGQVAGFLAEPILGVGGIVTPPREYFPIVVEIVRKHGGVFVCDEVQTGFGRTGGTWWGIEHWAVEPEIMTMAKGIANGFPLSVCICTAPIADSLKALTISTFGGNPISCTAALATLEYLEQHRLVENAARTGGLLREGLERLKRKYPRLLGDVRGMGLMQGVEFVADETAHDRTPNPQALTRLFEETKKRGLLIGRGGLYGNVARIAPPLVVSETEVDEAVTLLDGSLAAMGAA
jgi:4-aminobutyrate aminotransferase-like enzyme